MPKQRPAMTQMVPVLTNAHIANAETSLVLKGQRRLLTAWSMECRTNDQCGTLNKMLHGIAHDRVEKMARCVSLSTISLVQAPVLWYLDIAVIARVFVIVTWNSTVAVVRTSVTSDIVLTFTQFCLPSSSLPVSLILHRLPLSQARLFHAIHNPICDGSSLLCQ